MRRKRLPSSTAKPLKAGRLLSTKRVPANPAHRAAAAVVAATAAVAMVAAVAATGVVGAMVAVAADVATAASVADAKNFRREFSKSARGQLGRFVFTSERGLVNSGRAKLF